MREEMRQYYKSLIDEEKDATHFGYGGQCPTNRNAVLYSDGTQFICLGLVRDSDVSNFEDAEAFCEKHYNGHLLSIRNLKEHDFLLSILSQTRSITDDILQLIPLGLKGDPNMAVAFTDGTDASYVLEWYKPYNDSGNFDDYSDKPCYFLMFSTLAYWQGRQKPPAETFVIDWFSTVLVIVSGGVIVGSIIVVLYVTYVTRALPYVSKGVLSDYGVLVKPKVVRPYEEISDKSSRTYDIADSGN
ncbi:unnamed protein product [Enterobius vermicularis]|uniref:C-type lectin domain-containing protein n=1 Tax=Enterobius vermicularis TaxID=51028 RepID=A0A0N4V0D3_ENTVE|nr:unnamed protein product [Enterobius vermicularis]